MMHPSNGEAWKHFNSVHPYFSAQSSNVHLELCTNRFSPFGSFAAPLGMCMRSEFMFLSMVIPGPNSPGHNIDVYFRPLIDELMQLWSSGALTYDVS